MVKNNIYFKICLYSLIGVLKISKNLNLNKFMKLGNNIILAYTACEVNNLEFKIIKF